LQYGIIANNRKKAIQTLFWDSEKEFFFDYDLKKEITTDRLSLGAMFPLFFGIATKEQAQSCAKRIEEDFLQDGGLLTTPYNTGQQWDAPNGWAPLQWISIKGLLNYEHKSLAREIALRWTKLNEHVFQRTGKMLEKYNVVDTNLEGGGGEYPAQDGFGWTNGVCLAIKNA
jgi:alpha,alpha-trehalase